MNSRTRWILLAVGGGLSALGIGGVIFMTQASIQRSRDEVVALDTEIDGARKLIAKTPVLEREVILQRETDEVVAEILPNDEDINNLVRTLQGFEEESSVQISSLKQSKVPDTKKSDFDLVAYTLQLGADAFQLLSFLDLVETHPRFMTVPGFKLQAARRMNDDGMPRHTVQVDVETYVYEPTAEAERVDIEGYERKRELLLGEIAARRDELMLPAYVYKGPRGRRDPWVDPRVPVMDGDDPALTIEQQIALVDELLGRVEAAYGLWGEVQAAQSIIEEMKTRSELASEMARLEEEIRRVEEEGQLRFVPSERRFQNEVVAALADLRTKVQQSEGGLGPSIEDLREIVRGMKRHLAAGEYDHALSAYGDIEARLELAERDPNRKPVVDDIRRWRHAATAFHDFDAYELEVGGVLVHEGFDPVAVINGRSVGEGEMLDDELFVRAIDRNQIEFLFRGVVFHKTLMP